MSILPIKQIGRLAKIEGPIEGNGIAEDSGVQEAF